jgi:quercetin dioxygenase-like cupin family protein
MPAGLIRAHEVRRTETPNAVMNTLASPSQGATRDLSMWTVQMRAGQRGPLHSFDSEQIWHLLDGKVQIVTDGKQFALGVGDTAVLAAGLERQVTALSDAQMLVCGRGTAVASVSGEAAPRGVPAWIG